MESCGDEENYLTLHRLLDREAAEARFEVLGLAYGVMVALQILVLPVQVRILVSQLPQNLD